MTQKELYRQATLYANKVNNQLKTNRYQITPQGPSQRRGELRDDILTLDIESDNVRPEFLSVSIVVQSAMHNLIVVEENTLIPDSDWETLVANMHESVRLFDKATQMNEVTNA